MSTLPPSSSMVGPSSMSVFPPGSSSPPPFPSSSSSCPPPPSDLIGVLQNPPDAFKGQSGPNYDATDTSPGSEIRISLKNPDGSDPPSWMAEYIYWKGYVNDVETPSAITGSGFNVTFHQVKDAPLVKAKAFWCCQPSSSSVLPPTSSSSTPPPHSSSTSTSSSHYLSSSSLTSSGSSSSGSSSSSCSISSSSSYSSSSTSSRSSIESLDSSSIFPSSAESSLGSIQSFTRILTAESECGGTVWEGSVQYKEVPEDDAPPCPPAEDPEAAWPPSFSSGAGTSNGTPGLSSGASTGGVAAGMNSGNLAGAQLGLVQQAGPARLNQTGTLNVSMPTPPANNYTQLMGLSLNSQVRSANPAGFGVSTSVNRQLLVRGSGTESVYLLGDAGMAAKFADPDVNGFYVTPAGSRSTLQKTVSGFQEVDVVTNRTWEYMERHTNVLQQHSGPHKIDGAGWSGNHDQLHIDQWFPKDNRLCRRSRSVLFFRPVGHLHVLVFSTRWFVFVDWLRCLRG